MKKNILNLKGVEILNKKQQSIINGSGTPIGFCNVNGVCPGGSYCGADGLCYKDDNGNGGGDTCTEPLRLCMEGEIGCGCIFL
ncbi:hypothetical protein [Aquimarina rhabdastrellae]